MCVAVLEGSYFNKELVVKNLNDGIYSRSDILSVAQQLQPQFKETQFRGFLDSLITSKLLVRVGRNQYKKASDYPQKEIYQGDYSETAFAVEAFMEKRFPLLTFQIWDFNWLNEFINHLIGKNIIFLDVEKDGYMFAFRELAYLYPGRVLVLPDSNTLYYYGSRDGIVVNRLVSEAPKSKGNPNKAPLERLIVDLLADDIFPLSRGDFPFAFEEMFSKYYINQVAMMRYARRRNVHEKVYRFLKEETQVELTV